MAVHTSSVLGASLVAPDTTKLFALGTRIHGTDDTWWEYVEATSTLTTGELCLVNPNGSALLATTALLAAPGVQGLDIGFPQFTISEGEFGFVAKQGRKLYVLCTGTIAAGTQVGVVFNGRLGPNPAVGQTMAGVHITTSASTAEASVAIATVTWPRWSLTSGVQS